ncbi:MAG: hypothetical protein GX777_11005, partial [Fastidiosipila sp.]|nr:hypothetical protein [Fastidiosipila sp.]
KAMPDREKVEMIELTSADYQYYEPEETKSIFVYPFGYVTNYSQKTVEDEAAIDEIMKIHRQMVDYWFTLDITSRQHESMAPFNNPHLRLVYLDKNGDKLLTRTYYVYGLEQRQALEEISGIELIMPAVDK